MKTIALVALVAFASAAHAEPDLRPRPARYVRTTQLVAATRGDPEVNAMARSLEARSTASTMIAILSLAVGLGMAGYGMTMTTCETVAGEKQCSPRYGVIAIGGGIAAVGAIVGFGGSPKADDYLGVAQAWNDRHPEQPIDVR